MTLQGFINRQSSEKPKDRSVEMRTKNLVKFTGIIFALALMAASSAQASTCDSFPKVPWWGSLSH